MASDNFTELNVKITADSSALDRGLDQAVSKTQEAAREAAQVAMQASTRSRQAELNAAIDLHVLRTKLSGDKWAVEEDAINATYAKEKSALTALAAEGQKVRERSRHADIALQVRLQELQKAKAAEVARIAGLEEEAANKVSALELRLRGKNYAADVAAANAAHAKKIADINALAATETTVKNRLRAADLEHELKLRDLQQQRLNEFAQKAGNLGGKLTLGVTAPIMAVGGAAIKAAIDMDSLERALITVSGSASVANRQMKELELIAKRPGIGFKESIDAAVKLQSVGQNFQFVTREIKAFGNAIASAGGGKNELAAVVTQLTQMAGKRSAMMNDIRIIQDYVPQMLKAMMNVYKTVDTEAIQKMGITSEQFIQDIVAELEKLPPITNLVKNNIDNLSDEAFRALASAGKRALPTIIQLTKSGESLLVAWQKLSPAAQDMAIKTVLVAAAVGPVVTIISKVTGLYALLIARKLANTTATIAETVAVNANTAAQTANASALSRLLTASKNFVARNGLTLAFAAATISIGIFLAKVKATKDEIDKLASKAHKLPKWVEMKNEERLVEQFAGMSDKRLEATMRENDKRIEQAEKQKARAEKAASWRFGFDAKVGLISPLLGLYAGSVPDMSGRVDAANAKAEIDRLNHQQDLLEQEIAKRKSGGGISALIKQQTEDQQKAIAENDKLNTLAKQDMWILRQTSEVDREKAQAWVEYTRRKDDILARQKETQAKTGAIVDVTDQLNAAMAEYKDKLKSINDKSAEAKRDTENSIAVAKYELAALQQKDRFASQALSIQANYLRTYHDLVKSKASEQELAVAALQYQKDIAALEEERAAFLAGGKINAAFAKADAEAIASGDKTRLDKNAAYRKMYDEFAEFEKLIKDGMPLEFVIPLRDKSVAEFRQSIKEIEDAKATEEKRVLEESFEKRKTNWIDHVKALSALNENEAYLRGDALSGKIDAIKSDAEIEIQQLTWDRSKATDPDAIAAIDAKISASRIATQRKLFDAMTGGWDAIKAKVQEAKDSEIRAWEDRKRAMTDYYEKMRRSVQFMSLSQAWEKNVLSSLQGSVPAPMLPQAPATQATSQDYANAVQELMRTSATQTTFLESIANDIKKLVVPQGA